MAPASDQELSDQVVAVCDSLAALADAMANDGMLVASGLVLAGRQAIRALWVRLHPPPKPEPPPGG